MWRSSSTTRTVFIERTIPSGLGRDGPRRKLDVSHHYGDRARMFATLLGSLPRPPVPADEAPGEVLAAVVEAQERAGLEPIIDGGFGVGDTAVDRWRATAALTDRPVKAVLTGPYSTLAVPDAIDALRRDLLGLVAAGCPYIEIHEPAATSIGTDDAERTLFREA